MIKRTHSRNQKTKGVRVKHFLQICLLLGVCFWLIYQVKHSHDKKAALAEKNAKSSIKNLSDGELLKLGRKDLPHQEVIKNEKQQEEEEEETAGEEEEKHLVEVREEEDQKHEVDEREEEDQKHEVGEREEEDQKHEVDEREEEDQKHEVDEREEEDPKHEAEEQEEEEAKNEDIEDEGRGAGDDEIDENEQEKKEGEADHDEDIVDEEKEREDEGNEKDGDKNESEEREHQAENENSLDDQDNDTHDNNAHEAREENYKGDDASSAVTHDTQNSEASALEKDIKSNDNSRMVDGVMAENGTSLNVTASEEKVNDAMSNPVDSSLLNATVKTQSNALPEARNNSTEINGATDSYQQNVTETVSESVHSQNETLDGTTTGEGMTIQTLVVEQANNTASQNNQSDSNSTISTKIESADGVSGESSNSSKKVETDVSENILRSDGTAETENGSSSPTIKEITDTSHNEESNGTSESGRTDEGSDPTNVTEDVVQHDPIDSSDSHIAEAEKEARTDLDTLPEIKTEGDENGEAAAE
ncbi:hypothetical protein GBA52_027476 [Prunus armeniaca]|nr:hypothetical protein GBA52_027476 [Prunus armeniaca]